MAPRRPSHLDVPPAVSSSEDEEETSSSSEEEEAASEDEQVQPTPKPLVVSKKTDHSDSDSSESEPEPADSPVKPIASKPMGDKKARPKPAVDSTPEKKSAAKRPQEAEDSKKRAKKKKGGSEAPPSEAAEDEEEPKKSGGGDESKKLFQRLWSEDDEIVMLNGMIEYASEKGANPASDMNAFHDFIKKSLHVEGSRAQLTDKVRRLKKKYENNAKKKKFNPTKPHELKLFELSKKIWGGDQGEEPKSNSSATAWKNTLKKSNGKALLKECSRNTQIGVKESVSARVSEVQEIGLKSMPEHVLKNGLDLLPESKKAELEAKWNKLHIDELDLFLRRNQLISEKVKLVIEKLKSSDD